MRAVALAACAVEIALSLVAALSECGSCRKTPSLAWLGVGFYAALGVAILVPRCRPPAAFMMRWAFAIHLALVATMIRQRDMCVVCIACGALSVPLLLASLVHDESPAWRWGLEFVPIVLAAFAFVSTVVAPPPTFAPSDKTEIVVYRSDRCPRCIEFEQTVLPRLPKDRKVTLLDADHYDFIRFTPTIVIRGRDKTKVFEGAPDFDEFLKAVEP